MLGRWSFWGPASEKKWYGTHSDEPDGDWDRTAERMMLNFASSALERGGRIKKQRKGKGSEENIELLLRTIICMNQLSVHGAVADLCKELSKAFGSYRETCIE